MTTIVVTPDCENRRILNHESYYSIDARRKNGAINIYKIRRVKIPFIS